jgi:beta-lactamase regulating signal transducer with metallopeptidase domain
MPLQHLWVLHAIATLFQLHRSAPVFATVTRRAAVSTIRTSNKRSSSTPPRRSVVELVDSLARRDDLHSAPGGGACSERGRERSNMRV